MSFPEILPVVVRLPDTVVPLNDLNIIPPFVELRIRLCVFPVPEMVAVGMASTFESPSVVVLLIMSLPVSEGALQYC